MPADGLAPCGARPSAGSVMSRFSYYIHAGLAPEALTFPIAVTFILRCGFGSCPGKGSLAEPRLVLNHWYFISLEIVFRKKKKKMQRLRNMSVQLWYMAYWYYHCPASRTTLVATRFRVAVICPIIQVPHCIRVFFYFVWFVFINHIFQFYYELCTYCNILDIYLS